MPGHDAQVRTIAVECPGPLQRFRLLFRPSIDQQRNPQWSSGVFEMFVDPSDVANKEPRSIMGVHEYAGCAWGVPGCGDVPNSLIPKYIEGRPPKHLARLSCIKGMHAPFDGLAHPGFWKPHI